MGVQTIMATVPKEDIPGNLVPASDLPKNLRTPEPKEEDGFGTRVRKIATEAGVGGLAGAFAPEILTGLGAASAAFPVTAPAAPFLFGSGQALRGARLGSAVSGAFGGAASEVLGQGTKAAGYGEPVEQAVRFAGGMLGPEAVASAARGVAKTTGLTYLLNRLTGTPIGSALRTLGSVAKEKGLKELNLPAQQQQFIEEKLNAIRGGAESFQPAKDVFAMFRQGADNILRQAETQSAYLERQANDLIAQAQSQSGPASKELSFKISRLQSQYNAGADKIRSAAEVEANKLRDQAKKLAQAVRDKYSTQTPELRTQADKEATAILTTADQEANKIVSDSKQKVAKMMEMIDRVAKSAEKRVSAVQEKAGAIGQKLKTSESGGLIRKLFDDEFTRLKGIREGNVQTTKTAAFKEAAEKERIGERYQGTKAYGEAISGISNIIKDSETGLLNVGPDELKVLTSIKNLLERGVSQKSKDEAGKEIVTHTPLSFQGLENERRKFRDRSFGLPAEGYDAIGQQRAGDIADYIEKIQKDFSSGFEKYLEQYKADSKPLNDFKSKLGQAIIGKSESDFGKFAIDEFDLADKAFYSLGSVNQLIKIVGEKETEQLARSYIASKIGDGSNKEILSAIKDRHISDWIGKFPKLETELNTLAQQSGIAERVKSKRTEFAKALRTEIGDTPSVVAKKIEKIRKLERQAQELPLKIEERGEAKAGRVMRDVEKQIESGAEVTRGQVKTLEKEAADAQTARMQETSKRAEPLTKQAGEITTKAQQKADLILGKAVEPKRVADFLLRGDREEWSTIAPIISGTPGGKEKLASAVGQVIADRANQSLKGALADMKLMADNLVSSNLMSQAESQKLIDKLQEVFVMPVDQEMRATLTQRLIRNAIVTVYPMAESAGEKVGAATR
jgi:hypothetical protein